ncbi:MAG: hypothetical protein FGM57_02285 [Candidatus Taylorbacteria bacterium]|nr:hypothetical protein [Candidatus Taylorbacteria bacterium]
MKHIYKIEDIEHYHDDWDRSHKSSCDWCWIGINDLGIPQCRDCLALFNWKRDKILIMKYLSEQFGEEFSKDEWLVLKKVQELLHTRMFSQLICVLYTYTDNNGKIKTDRQFYDKK